MDSNNNIITRIVVSKTSAIGGRDVCVGVLDSDLPDTITYYPVMTQTDYSNYIAGSTQPLAVWDDQNSAANIMKTTLSSGSEGYIEPAADSIQHPYWKLPAGGDSGSPVFWVIGGKLVLGSTAYTPTFGDGPSNMISTINSAMTAMGGGNSYQLTTVDLSSFLDYSVITVPAQSFSLSENASAGSAVGTVAATGGATPFLFTILSGNTGNAFAIDGTTGALTVNNADALDFDTAPAYSLVVQVKNTWTPQTTETATVTIDLTQVSGHTPPSYGTVSTSGAWTQRFSQSSPNFSHITSSSDGTKLAATEFYGSIYTSADSGTTWVERQASVVDKSWQAIAYSPDGSHLYASDNDVIYISTDDGATWTTSASAGGGGLYLNGISFANTSGTSLVGVDNITNNMVTSTDAGATWTDHPAPDGQLWIAIESYANGMKLVAADGGIDGYLYTSTDNGVTWTPRTSGAETFWGSSVTFTASSDGTKLATYGDDGYIYTSADSGTTWTAQTGSGVRLWNSITSPADGTRLAATDGDSGSIYTSADSGVTWTEQTDPDTNVFASITFSADGTKLAAAGYYGVYTSTDFGATWTRRYAPGAMGGRQAASSSDGTKLVSVVYSAGVYNLYTSADSGLTWTLQTAAGTRQWSDVASSSDGTKLAATVGSADSYYAYTGYIYTSTDSGATWTAQTGSGLRQWTSITSSADGTKLAATVQNGYIYTSADSGATWTA